MNSLNTSGARPLFSLGRLLVTPGAMSEIHTAGASMLDLLNRHQHGDWGDTGDYSRDENDFALQWRLRLLSCYTLSNGASVWVIKEADRSATTILLPDEY
jgi:hypothetical protein